MLFVAGTRHLKTHLFSSFSQDKEHNVVAPSLAAPLYANRSTVGSGTREDIVTVPDVIWVSEGHDRGSQGCCLEHGNDVRRVACR